MFKSGMKLNKFYNLLVKDIDTKNQSTGSKLLASAESAKCQTTVNNVWEQCQTKRNVIELSYSFNHTTNFYYCYVLRTIGELTMTAGLLTWLIYHGMDLFFKDNVNVVGCNVYGYWYECAGHPQRLYTNVLFIAMVLLVGYMLCNFYNLLWLLYPNFGKLSRVMER